MRLSTLLSNLPPDLPIWAQAARFRDVGEYRDALLPRAGRMVFYDPEIEVRIEGPYLSLYQQPPVGCFQISWLAAIELPPAESGNVDTPGAE